MLDTQAIPPVSELVTKNPGGSEKGPSECASLGSRTASWREWALFLFISFAVTLVLFWPAVTGEKILAPLDIAPNFFSKFRYVDPAANGIPANHYVVDLMLGDISRNRLVHQAWQRGEMPWWDPYTDSGKPLAAEANAVNISDPWKVLIFHLLPFEAAYNWIRIVPFLLSGLAAFCLLKYLGIGRAPALWGALLYQFAGCNTMMFSGPTVQAAFVYYPWLWIMWDRGVNSGKFSWFAGSSLLTALIFLSGNLQSHSYVFLFATVFFIGNGWRQLRRWPLLAGGISFALIIGLCLSAPFVLSQMELFILNVRKVRPETSPLSYFSGIASLVAFFPWLFGTFRTLDLSKVFGQSGLGFWIYIGSAAIIISLIGIFVQPVADSRTRNIRRTALGLVVSYLIVCSTPLLNILYTRVAWLPVLGLIIFLGLGWSGVTKYAIQRRWGHIIIAGTALIIVAIHVGSLMVFPRYRPKIEERILSQDRTNQALDSAPVLRKFQIANWAHETTFQNPEIIFTCAGLLVLGGILLRRPMSPTLWLHATMILSTVPLLLLAHRYIPMQSMELWTKIRDGGPEQRRVAEALQPQGLRLREKAPGPNDYVFPGAMAQLYGVHVQQGHSSLKLENVAFFQTNGVADPAFYDFEYHNVSRGLERGELNARPGPAARYHWTSPNERAVSITSETLCSIELNITPGPSAELIRTDTYYPGWRAATPGVTLQFEPPCFARLHVPSDVTHVRLEYEPRWLRTGIYFACGGAILIALSLFFSARRGAEPIALGN